MGFHRKNVDILRLSTVLLVMASPAFAQASGGFFPFVNLVSYVLLFAFVVLAFLWWRKGRKPAVIGAHMIAAVDDGFSITPSADGKINPLCNQRFGHRNWGLVRLHPRRLVFRNDLLASFPPQGIVASEEELRQAADRAEKILDLDNQPRDIVFHEKNGRRHPSAEVRRSSAHYGRARCHRWITLSRANGMPVAHVARELSAASNGLYLLPQMEEGRHVSPYLSLPLSERTAAKRPCADAQYYLHRFTIRQNQ